jgi:type IV pilus assembly protein PilE
MDRRNRTGRAASAGFTLIELMVTILIGAILLSIAVPAYQAQIRKSRRVEAKNALLDLAAREERFYSTNNVYTTDPASLGYASFGGTIGSGYYTLSAPTLIAASAGPPPTQAGFSITATATGTQTKDIGCQTFTVTNTGAQSSTGGGVDCW